MPIVRVLHDQQPLAEFALSERSRFSATFSLCSASVTSIQSAAQFVNYNCYSVLHICGQLHDLPFRSQWQEMIYAKLCIILFLYWTGGLLEYFEYVILLCLVKFDV